jgi:hypothetical protein
MVTVHPDVLAAHAQHVHLFAEQLRRAKDHTKHDGLWTEIALGGLGQLIFLPMDNKINSCSDTMAALADKAAEVKKRIDATAQHWNFTEQANKDLMDKTKTKIQDPDLFHAPKSLNDFPDMGLSGDIGQFASNCPQYAQAGWIPVTLGAVGLALDVLGYALDPVGNVFGELAGLIIDLVVPLRKILDFLLGDPGALQDASTAFDEIARYLSETAHTFNASLSEITPKDWDEPGASDVYVKAANNLVQLTITAGSGAEEISGDIFCIGSLLGDVRSKVFDHIVGFVLEAVFEAALGVAFSEVTFGASLAVATGIIETEAALTAASIAAELAAAAARLIAAAIVAHSQAENYDRLVADIKK